MVFIKKIIFIFILSQYILGCVEKTTYSGKIITSNDLELKILTKNELINKFGKPSYIDNKSKTYFYFTEKKKEVNFYNKKIEYSYLFVFKLDEGDKVINSETVDLLIDKNHKYRKIQTNNNIIKRGLIEKVFGGIGPKTMPNSP